MTRSVLTAMLLLCASVASVPAAEAACPEGCSGHGLCLEDTCFCDPGWTGKACEVDDGSCIGACSGNGVCTFGKCFCDAGWSGDQCEIPPETCPKDCSGRGICKAGQCFCEAGFSGDDCGIEATCPASCSGRGLCQHGKCFCEPGFSGEDCGAEAKCPSGCSGRGLCLYGKCYCEPGFSGEDCSAEAKCPSGCSDRGVCQYGKCFCEPGFSGEDCSAETKCPSGCSDRGVCHAGKCFCEPGYSGEDCATRDGIVLESIIVDNPTFEAGPGVITSVLALGIAPEVVITLADAATGRELQAMRHPLPANLVDNGTVRSLGFGGGVTLVTSVQWPYRLRYSLAVESPDPNDPGVVLLDFAVPSLDTGLPEEQLDALAKLPKSGTKEAKGGFADGEEVAVRVAKLAVLAGIDTMDAGVFAEGSWAASAERAVLQAGLEAAGVGVRVVSPGASFSEQELWDTFLASLPAGCNAAGTAFGDFGALPKECRPNKKLTFSAGKKSPPPHSVTTYGIIGNCGFRQDDRACYGTTYFRNGGGFVFGTTSYFEVRVSAAAPPGGGDWPPSVATPATIGEVLIGEPLVRQVMTLAEGDAVEALGLPNAQALAEVGVAVQSGDETTTKIRRRTKGGFVVDVTGVEPPTPSGGGTSSGTWLGGYEIP